MLCCPRLPSVPCPCSCCFERFRIFDHKQLRTECIAFSEWLQVCALCNPKTKAAWRAWGGACPASKRTKRLDRRCFAFWSLFLHNCGLLYNYIYIPAVYTLPPIPAPSSRATSPLLVCRGFLLDCLPVALVDEPARNVNEQDWKDEKKSHSINNNMSMGYVVCASNRVHDFEFFKLRRLHRRLRPACSSGSVALLFFAPALLHDRFTILCSKTLVVLEEVFF